MIELKTKTSTGTALKDQIFLEGVKCGSRSSQGPGVPCSVQALESCLFPCKPRGESLRLVKYYQRCPESVKVDDG